MKKSTFADRVLDFNENILTQSIVLPNGYKVINPFIGDNQRVVKKITTEFYKKYYDDTFPRRLILGSSPARRGTAVTGIPFEDTDYIQKEMGIVINNFHISAPSSEFLQDVIMKYGGRKKFYSNFYMNFVCPIGIVKINENGKEVNCNYYDNKILQDTLYPFIIQTLRTQLSMGIDSTVCYCIGSGKNYEFLTKVNNKHGLFDSIIPLEHPRYIMQYNSKYRDLYFNKYIDSLNHL